MALPMTLAMQPPAGAVSKPLDYKHNIQKMKGLLKMKKRVLTGKQFEGFRQKIQKFHSSHGEQNKSTTRHWRRKLNMNQVARKKLTGAKLKKAFGIKLFELCRTRTKKSSPDLFKFYVVSAGHGMVNDHDRATTCRCNFKAPWLHTERTKIEGPSENEKKIVLTGKQFEGFRQKNSKIPLLPWRTKQTNHKTLKAKTEHEPCSQKEINWSKIEKRIQNKTVWNLQD